MVSKSDFTFLNFQIVFNENSTYTYNSTSHWTGAAYLYLEAKPKDICRVHSIEYFDKN